MPESRFIRFCVSSLERMYLPAEQTFSASYRRCNGNMRNVRNREQEFKYTMNTLMGLYRVRSAGTPIFIDVESAYHRLAAQVDQQSHNDENVAAAVWTGACLGVDIPLAALSRFVRTFLEPPIPWRLTAQAVAWAIAACSELRGDYTARALMLARIAADRYVHPESALVRHQCRGLRMDWASFAASCYTCYSMLRLGRLAGESWARDEGLRIARTLVRLQGPSGQWGWFYHVPSGKLVDYYPVYSVHQHSMAPLFLLEAIDQGYPEFRQPLVRGFRWILGENELSRCMVDSTARVIWRSMVRKSERSRLARLGRGARLIHGDARLGVEKSPNLTLTWECRSYELGWATWIFAGRQDYPEILDHACFEEVRQ